MAKEKGPTHIELTAGDGAVIIREDGTYNLFMPDKQLDMALSFTHGNSARRLSSRQKCVIPKFGPHCSDGAYKSNSRWLIGWMNFAERT